MESKRPALRLRLPSNGDDELVLCFRWSWRQRETAVWEKPSRSAETFQTPTFAPVHSSEPKSAPICVFVSTVNVIAPNWTNLYWEAPHCSKSQRAQLPKCQLTSMVWWMRVTWLGLESDLRWKFYGFEFNFNTDDSRCHSYFRFLTRDWESMDCSYNTSSWQQPITLHRPKGGAFSNIQILKHWSQQSLASLNSFLLQQMISAVNNAFAGTASSTHREQETTTSLW